MKSIFFVGYRASGKTTVATALAKVGGWTAVDTDTAVVEMAQSPIADIVARHGWEHFRNLEHDVLRTFSCFSGIFDGHAQDCNAQNREDTTNPRYAKLIFATGGGIILREDNRKILKSMSAEKKALVIFLDLPVHDIVERLRHNPLHAQRPSLTDASLTEEVESVLHERMPLYKDAADVILDARRPVDDLVHEILGLLEK